MIDKEPIYRSLKNPAELINDWTLKHFKEIFVLTDKDGKEIDFKIKRVPRRKPRS